MGFVVARLPTSRWVETAACDSLQSGRCDVGFGVFSCRAASGSHESPASLMERTGFENSVACIRGSCCSEATKCTPSFKLPTRGWGHGTSLPSARTPFRRRLNASGIPQFLGTGPQLRRQNRVRCVFEGSSGHSFIHDNMNPMWPLPVSENGHGKGPFGGAGDGIAGLEEQSRSLRSVQTSMTKAFSSMVLMLKALQTYALQMRSMLYYEDVESVALVIHREMQASLLWLFQQVFSCTPMLMVSVMLLFSDFTVYSASSNISLGHVSDFSISDPARLRTHTHQISVASASAVLDAAWASDEAPATVSSFGGDLGGKGGRAGVGVIPFDDGEETRDGSEGRHIRADSNGLTSYAVLERTDRISGTQDNETGVGSGNAALARLLESTVKGMGVQKGKPVAHLRLDQEIIRQLIAPVCIQVEKDDYACFDRTDLEYQHAIEADPVNPMLLSNYAQFLYIVRRDYNKSEAFFRRALNVDPADGDILGRFATFLWLGRRDRDGAERAYKAALASNPDNPYYTGSYAHFMWHSGEDESACPVV